MTSAGNLMLQGLGVNGFSPLSLTPFLWLDAADTATISATGGLVDSWADKSGNGNTATAVTTQRPTTGATTQNGHNVIDFDGTRYLTLTSTVSIASGGPQTVWVVVKKQAVANYSVPLSGGGSGEYINLSVSSSAGTASGSRNAATPLSPSVSVNAWHTFCLYDSGASETMYADGTGGTPLSAAYGAMSWQRIGYYTSAGFFLKGNIGEIIIMKAAASAQQLLDVQAYLKAKWSTP